MSFIRDDLNKQGKQSVTRVDVKIYNDEYVMKGTSDPDYMKMIAQYVDKKMRMVAANNPSLSNTKIAVLAALNIADELSKLQQEYDSLVKLIEEEKQPNT